MHCIQSSATAGLVSDLSSCPGPADQCGMDGRQRSKLILEGCSNILYYYIYVGLRMEEVDAIEPPGHLVSADVLHCELPGRYPS